MWVHALHQSTNENAQRTAHQLADKWVRSCWNSWKKDDKCRMYEKVGSKIHNIRFLKVESNMEKVTFTWFGKTGLGS